MRILLGIAIKHIRNRPRATLVSILGVATGVGFSIAMAALMEGSQRDFIAKIVDSSPHILVKDEYRTPPVQPVERVFGETGAVELRGAKPKEELRGIKRARERVAELDRLPGARAAPLLRGQAVMRFAGKDASAAIVGIDLDSYRRVSQLPQDMTAGTLEALETTANGLIVGSGMLRKLGAALGDTIGVSSPAGVYMKMKIVGVFHTGVVGLDEGEVYTLLKKAQVLQARENVINQIRISVDDVYAAHALARRIEARTGYLSESWDEANQDILEALKVRNVIMYTVVGAILLVAGLGIYNIVSTFTFEKIRDIAILKSLGFESADIRTIFVAEGLLTGTVGSVIGWGLGYALCRIMGSIEFQVRWATEMTSLPLYYTPVHYAAATALAVLTAGLAAFLPARKAAAVDPVEIIRGAA